MRVLVLHGPNLNLLGRREPEIYGRVTLAEIDATLERAAGRLGVELRCLQRNGEGEMVDAVQEALGWADGIVVNPAAYSHTSVALRDALAAVDIPVIEVHLTNPAAREDFRHRDLIAGVCRAVVAGFGPAGYVLALERLAEARGGGEAAR